MLHSPRKCSLPTFHQWKPCIPLSMQQRKWNPQAKTQMPWAHSSSKVAKCYLPILHSKRCFNLFYQGATCAKSNVNKTIIIHSLLNAIHVQTSKGLNTKVEIFLLWNSASYCACPKEVKIKCSISLSLPNLFSVFFLLNHHPKLSSTSHYRDYT